MRIEDDLKKHENGRRPKKNENGRRPPFFFKLEWRPQKKEDDLKKKWKTTLKKIEDDLKKK